MQDGVLFSKLYYNVQLYMKYSERDCLRFMGFILRETRLCSEDGTMQGVQDWLIADWQLYFTKCCLALFENRKYLQTCQFVNNFLQTVEGKCWALFGCNKSNALPAPQGFVLFILILVNFGPDLLSSFELSIQVDRSFHTHESNSIKYLYATFVRHEVHLSI